MLEVKRLEREAWQRPSPTAEVNNAFSFTSSPPTYLASASAHFVISSAVFFEHYSPGAQLCPLRNSIGRRSLYQEPLLCYWISWWFFRSLDILVRATTHTKRRMDVAATVYICTLEVIGSNLGRNTRWTDRNFSWPSSVPPGKCPDTAPVRSRPHPSKSLPIHYSSVILPLNLYILDTDNLVK
jgi:hypothetical protein